MSVMDRVFRALGIFLAGTFLSWMVTFGLIFLDEVAHHQQAHIPPAGGQAILIIPSALTFVSLLAGIGTSVKT